MDIRITSFNVKSRKSGITSSWSAISREVGSIASGPQGRRCIERYWVSLGVLPFVFYLMPWTGMSLQSLQQLTGANYFFYYGATIFQSVGLEDSFVTQIILGTVNFVCTFGGIYVMEKARVCPPRFRIVSLPSIVRSQETSHRWWCLAVMLAVRLRCCRYRQSSSG
jgi:hypothetical protein